MSKVNRYKNRYHKGENMSEAFEENIEQAAAQEQTVNFDQGWFVIQTYSGYENKVKENLLERAQTYNMTDNILRIEIPTETVDKEVNGKRGFAMSVSTQPGATQFTSTLCRASSVESPLTKLMTAPLLAA